MTQKPIKHEGRQPTDVITKEHLEEFIATQDDFALELFAYSLARALGFNATHAGTYTDPQSGKARQFDVQASRYCGENLHVFMAIECKSLRPSFPLLVSQIPRIQDESYQDIVKSTGHTSDSSMLGEMRLRLTGGSLYPVNKYVGKAISQVGFNGEGKLHSKDSEVHDKWGQAIASCNQLIYKALSVTDKRFSVVLPVLVVPDGTLWVVNYSEDGTLVNGPTQIDETQYFISSKQTVNDPEPITYVLTHLHIVTKTGYASLLERFMKDGNDATQLINLVY
jgi:hypothetical protein